MSEQIYTDAEVAALQTSEAQLVLDGFKVRLRGEFLKTIEQHEMEYLSFTHGDVELITVLFDKAIKNLER